MRFREGKGQSGFGLVEVLIAMAVGGIVVGAIAGAMLTLTRVMSQTAKRQKVTAAMTSFAESIKVLDYVDCGTVDDDYDLASEPDAIDAQTMGVDSIVIKDISYWVRDSGDGTNEGAFVPVDQSGCAAGAASVLSDVDDGDGAGGGGAGAGGAIAGGGASAAPPVNPPGSPTGATANATQPANPDQGVQLFTIEVRLGDVVQQSTVSKRRP